MTLYALSQRTIATAGSSTAWEIRSSSTNKPKILEFGLSQVSAVNGSYGIGRPGSIGVTPTTPQTFADEGDGNAPASLTTGAVAWGTAPTAPSFFNRKITCTNVIGGGAIFSFPRGFVIPVSSSITLWLFSIAPVLDTYAVVDE
jgi:hypothetical protein